MGLFVVRYDYAENSAEAQDAHRPEHRDFLAAQPGLRAGGKTDDNGAYLVFEADDAESLAVLLKDDPFFTEGIVAATRISGWSIPLGSWKEPLGF